MVMTLCKWQLLASMHGPSNLSHISGQAAGVDAQGILYMYVRMAVCEFVFEMAV